MSELETQSIEAYKSWLDDNNLEVEYCGKDLDSCLTEWCTIVSPCWQLRYYYYRIKRKAK